MSFPWKCSQQFWGSHNLYITTTLKHELFSFLVCKEDFWKEKSFVRIFSEPPTSLNWIFGKSFPPEIFVLASPARSFLSRLEGVLTFIDLSFTTFGLVKSWRGGWPSECFFLWRLSLFLRPSPTVLPLLPLCLQIWIFFWKLGRGWETRIKGNKQGLKAREFLKFIEWQRVKTRKGSQVRVHPKARTRTARGQGQVR